MAICSRSWAPSAAIGCTGQVARGSFDPRVLLIYSLRDGTLPLKKTAGDDPTTKAARLVGPPVHIITAAQVKMLHE